MRSAWHSRRRWYSALAVEWLEFRAHELTRWLGRMKMRVLGGHPQ